MRGFEIEAGILPRVGTLQHECPHGPSGRKHEVEFIVLGKCIGIEPDRTEGIHVGERERIEGDHCRASRVQGHGLGLSLLPIQFEHDRSLFRCVPLAADHPGFCRHAFLAGEEISSEDQRRHRGIRCRFIGNQHRAHQRSSWKGHALVAVPPGALEVADDDDLPVRLLGLFQDRLSQLQGRAV